MNVSALTPAELEALLNGPALRPPPGVVPQLDNPPNSLDAAIAVQVVCLILTTFACGMRLYTRIALLRMMTVADCKLQGPREDSLEQFELTFSADSILLGWATFVGYFVPGWLLSNIAADVHQWNLRLKCLEPFLKYLHVGSVMYGFCTMFIKLSILLQYLELFVTGGKNSFMWWSCWILIVLNTVYYLASSLIEIWACHPVARVYDPFITTGYCINVFVLFIIAGGLNLLSDVVLLVLPQLTIWRLQMSTRQKWGLSLVFSIGIFACAASAVRLAYSVELYHSTDTTWYSWKVGVWTYAEITGGILVACLPVSFRFFQHMRRVLGNAGVGDGFRHIFGWLRFPSSSCTALTRESKHPPPRPSRTPSPVRGQGVWSRAFADLDSGTRGSPPRSPSRDVPGWDDNIHVMYSIDVDTKENREFVPGQPAPFPHHELMSGPAGRSARPARTGRTGKMGMTV